MTSILLALVIGAAFGFALDRIGATSPSWIGRMLSLTNLHLMKTILLAIGVGSVLMFAGQMFGIVDVGHMSVKALYPGVFLGGLLLGAGWALAGYCPGTGVAAAATGRKDAWFFLLGGLVGAAGYMASYPFWKGVGLLEGRKLTLGNVPEAGYDALLGLPGDVIGIVMGLLFIAAAFVLPEHLRGTGQVVAPAE
ncbi:MAG: DUF6691 family protein [Pseudomonadota bacterium]